MRLLTLCLIALLVLIQYPLWFGKGGWSRVQELSQQVEEVQEKNEVLKSRNVKLASEVDDLKEGKDAVEERARYDMGMIKQDEVFVQILKPDSQVQVEDPAAKKAAIAQSHNPTVRSTRQQ